MKWRGKEIDLFHPTPEQELHVAHELMKERFGSECKHEKVKDGRCRKCWRKVVDG